MEKIYLYGRVLTVTPVQMEAYKKALIRERDRSRRLGRELKQEHLLPSSRSGCAAALSGYVAPSEELDTRMVYAIEKSQRVEDLWLAHLQAEGL